MREPVAHQYPSLSPRPGSLAGFLMRANVYTSCGEAGCPLTRITDLVNIPPSHFKFPDISPFTERERN